MNKKQLIAVILGFFLLILEVLSSSAQVKEMESATKLQAFIAERGESIIPLVLSRRVHFEGNELGEVTGLDGGKIKLYSQLFYDPGEESKGVRGIKIRLTYPRIDEEYIISYIDFDEIERLSKKLEDMVNAINKWKGIEKEYILTYCTKGGFCVGVEQKETEQEAYAFVNDGGIFFTSPQSLNSVKSLIDKGLKLLSEK